MRIIRERSAPQLLTIIGIAGDVKHRGLEDDIRPELYLPHAQAFYNSSSIPSYLIVRTANDPLRLASAARQTIQLIDPNLPTADIRTMQARIDELIVQRRLRMVLLTTYAGLALLLAAVGIYGVLSHFVAQHTTEIGVRLALGAQVDDVLRFVVQRGMRLTLVGIGLGLLASSALTGLMKALLFGVSATDPLTFGVIASLLLVVAFVACFIPARRATKVDPLTALRSE